MGAVGTVKIPGYDDLSVDVTNATVQQLMMLRRQYITYSKMHAPNPEQIPLLYVQYLSSSIQ